MIHQNTPATQEWKEENLDPFDELLLSWNASRPSEGKFLFYISVKTNEWSPWLLYASWSSTEQSSFLSTTENAPVRTFQDTLEVLDGKKATAFRIKIITEGNCHLQDIHGLHVYINSDKSKAAQNTDACLDPIRLNVPGISQMALDHARHADLCSPTSTAAATQYLSNDYSINPLHFAQNIWDAGFDIFGNWVFNVAEASALLGKEWHCWVERLNGFNAIYHNLIQGTPVVVSVRGPLPGSALPYAKGHLMVVTGYDPLSEKVFCMDPAFAADAETHVSYQLSDFIQAWNQRGNVAYIFKRN